MPTSTKINERELTLVQPRDDQLYTREGLDRNQIRYEFSDSINIGLTDRWIENEDQLHVDHSTLDLADGPTGIGEGGSGGVSFLVEDGERIPTARYGKGYTVNTEDMRAGNDSIAEQRDALMELFDFEHDKRFLFGHWRGDGTWVPGLFQWLDDNIPSERVFDCSLYVGGESGDVADYAGVEENLIKYDAFSMISNRLMEVNDPQWGAMVGTQDALSNFNKVNEGSSDRSTYWERLNSNDSAGVGIERPLYMPDYIQFTRSASSQEPTRFHLTDGNNQGWDGLGSDEVYLLPDMEMARDNLWELYETPTPALMGPIQQEVGRTRFDYIERYAQRFDPTEEHPQATDCVKLTNVSALYS